MVLPKTPTAHQDDRAAGVLLAAACGDALGVPYEFRSRLDRDQSPQMIGGGLGPYAPGEYSHDTQMAVCIAQALVDTQPVAVQDDAATPWVAGAMLRQARDLWKSGRHAAGNGSLTRTGPVALYGLHDAGETADAARLVSELTHADPLAGDACVIWCEAIRHAVLHANFDGVRCGVALLPTERRAQWHTWLDEAESQDPHTFPDNGYVVTALQAAWSAITRTPVPADNPAKGVFAADHLRLALEAAVRAGHDTNTVAAIAGALLGARWGVSAVPWHWQRAVHGWPETTARDLIGLGVRISHHHMPDRHVWPLVDRHPRNANALTPYRVLHPHDDGVILGNLPLADLDPADLDVDAVVSLCRVGTADFAHVPARDHLRIWLIDRPGANAHGHYTLDQAARAVHGLRQEGKQVLLHCAAGRSRTPTAAARYSGLLGIDPTTAMTDVCQALAPNHPWVNFELERFVFDLAGAAQPAVAKRAWNTSTTLHSWSAQE